MPVPHVHCPTQYSVVLCHPRQTRRKQLLTSLTMSRFTITNKDANVLKGEEHVHHNGVDDEDNVCMKDTFFDEYGRFDASQALPNSDANPVKCVYTRNHTGRNVSVVCHLKVHLSYCKSGLWRGMYLWSQRSTQEIHRTVFYHQREEWHPLLVNFQYGWDGVSVSE